MLSVQELAQQVAKQYNMERKVEDDPRPTKQESITLDPKYGQIGKFYNYFMNFTEKKDEHDKIRITFHESKIDKWAQRNLLSHQVFEQNCAYNKDKYIEEQKQYPELLVPYDELNDKQPFTVEDHEQLRQRRVRYNKGAGTFGCDVDIYAPSLTNPENAGRVTIRNVQLFKQLTGIDPRHPEWYGGCWEVRKTVNSAIRKVHHVAPVEMGEEVYIEGKGYVSKEFAENQIEMVEPELKKTVESEQDSSQPQSESEETEKPSLD